MVPLSHVSFARTWYSALCFAIYLSLSFSEMDDYCARLPPTSLEPVFIVCTQETHNSNNVSPGKCVSPDEDDTREMNVCCVYVYNSKTHTHKHRVYIVSEYWTGCFGLWTKDLCARAKTRKNSVMKHDTIPRKCAQTSSSTRSMQTLNWTLSVRIERGNIYFKLTPEAAQTVVYWTEKLTLNH